MRGMTIFAGLFQVLFASVIRRVKFLFTAPFIVAMLFVIVAHWNRFMALVAANPAPPDDASFAMVMVLAPK